MEINPKLILNGIITILFNLQEETHIFSFIIKNLDGIFFEYPQIYKELLKDN